MPFAVDKKIVFNASTINRVINFDTLLAHSLID